MRRLTAVLALGVLCAANPARADMVGPGEKAVKLSLRVDAQVPAGHMLVLANTFRGADIVRPGEDQRIEWHPLRGAMQLRMIAADQAAKLEALRDALESEKARELVAPGVVCAAPFAGIRTISDALVAVEVRWHFRVAFADSGCQATLVTTDYLDADGKVVDPKATAPTAADMPSPTPPAAPTSAAAGPASAPAAPASAPAAAGCGCATGDVSGMGASLLVVLLLGARRRGGL